MDYRTNILYQNLERWLEERRASSETNETIQNCLRKINGHLLVRHSSLFSDPSFYMKAPECVMQGMPVMVKYEDFRTRLDISKIDLSESALDQLCGDIADEIAKEISYYNELLIRTGREGRGQYAYAPYILTLSRGVDVDPDTFDPYVRLGWMRGCIPLDQPCPPCAVSGKDADLTKFGLPPS